MNVPAYRQCKQGRIAENAEERNRTVDIEMNGFAIPVLMSNELSPLAMLGRCICIDGEYLLPAHYENTHPFLDHISIHMPSSGKGYKQQVWGTWRRAVDLFTLDQNQLLFI